MGISERDQQKTPDTLMANRIESAVKARDKRNVIENSEIADLLSKNDKTREEIVEAELIRFTLRAFGQRTMGADLRSLKTKKDELEKHIQDLGADNPSAQIMISIYNEVFPDRISSSAKGFGEEVENPSYWKINTDQKS